MARVTQAALVDRARSLMSDMMDRERWIYAVPAGNLAAVLQILEDGGVVRTEQVESGEVVKLVCERPPMSFIVFESEELQCVMVEARGISSASLMRTIVENVGFIKQSALLGAALDVGDPECARALRTLAHMVVSWDEDWSDLFLLHLASPDAVVRDTAASSLVIGAMVADAVDPACELLQEAARRERFPKLRDKLSEAVDVLRAFSGEAIGLP